MPRRATPVIAARPKLNNPRDAGKGTVVTFTNLVDAEVKVAPLGARILNVAGFRLAVPSAPVLKSPATVNKPAPIWIGVPFSTRKLADIELGRGELELAEKDAADAPFTLINPEPTPLPVKLPVSVNMAVSIVPPVGKPLNVSVSQKLEADHILLPLLLVVVAYAVSSPVLKLEVALPEPMEKVFVMLLVVTPPPPAIGVKQLVVTVASEP